MGRSVITYADEPRIEHQAWSRHDLGYCRPLGRGDLGVSIRLPDGRTGRIIGCGGDTAILAVPILPWHDAGEFL